MADTHPVDTGEAAEAERRRRGMPTRPPFNSNAADTPVVGATSSEPATQVTSTRYLPRAGPDRQDTPHAVRAAGPDRQATSNVARAAAEPDRQNTSNAARAAEPNRAISVAPVRRMIFTRSSSRAGLDERGFDSGGGATTATTERPEADATRGGRKRTRDEGGGSAAEQLDAQGEEAPNGGAVGERPPSSGTPAMRTIKGTRGIRPACGLDFCGDTRGWVHPCSPCGGKITHAGEGLCAACHQPAAVYWSSGRQRWRHLQDDAAVSEATRFLAEDANGEVRRRLVDGFVPSRACLCARPTCFFAALTKWKKRKLAAISRMRCAVCSATSASGWRRPGAHVDAVQEFFTTGKGCTVGEGWLAETGVQLLSGSVLCTACSSKFWHWYRMENTRKDKGIVANDAGGSADRPVMGIADFLASLESSDLSAATAAQKAEDTATREILRLLQDGNMVELEDGIKLLQAARARHYAGEVTRNHYRNGVRHIFFRISSNVKDAYGMEFNADTLGADARRRLYYSVPAILKPVHIARADQAAKQLRAEVLDLRQTITRLGLTASGNTISAQKIDYMGTRAYRDAARAAVGQPSHIEMIAGFSQAHAALGATSGDQTYAKSVAGVNGSHATAGRTGVGEIRADGIVTADFHQSRDKTVAGSDQTHAESVAGSNGHTIA